MGPTVGPLRHSLHDGSVTTWTSILGTPWSHLRGWAFIWAVANRLFEHRKGEDKDANYIQPLPTRYVSRFETKDRGTAAWLGPKGDLWDPVRVLILRWEDCDQSRRRKLSIRILTLMTNAKHIATVCNWMQSYIWNYLNIMDARYSCIENWPLLGQFLVFIWVPDLARGLNWISTWKSTFGARDVKCSHLLKMTGVLGWGKLVDSWIDVDQCSAMWIDTFDPQ